MCHHFLPCGMARHTAKLSFFAVCLSMWHTAKVAVFAVCLGQGTRQTGCSTGYASALYFAVGPIMHTAKYLPCARDVAHDKLALCRPLFAVSCLSCVTLGKHFAECKPAFAVCHTPNRHSPVVSAAHWRSHQRPCRTSCTACSRRPGKTGPPRVPCTW